MPDDKLLLADTTDQILKDFYHVYNTLGYGFLEKVYENSMLICLRRRGMDVFQQYPVAVYFEGVKVGKYFADLYVNGNVILEIKSTDAIGEADEAQLTNYLKATTLEVGLVLNFGPKPMFRRRVFTNDRKKGLPK
jgi:GxxExxY protein